MPPLSAAPRRHRRALVPFLAGAAALAALVGTTAATEPTWPLTENATVTDGAVTWEELTPVLVNRLPAPNGPQPTRLAGGGTFAAGRDVYLQITYLNPQGESIASAPGILVNTNANDGVQYEVQQVN